MQNKTFKKLVAITLAMSLTLGSAVTVFASDQEPASTSTGTGTSTGHMNTNVVSFTIPDDTTVDGLFNYYVDPERLINKAGTLMDGSEVSSNNDGVYFKTVEEGAYGEQYKQVSNPNNQGISNYYDRTTTYVQTSDDKALMYKVYYTVSGQDADGNDIYKEAINTDKMGVTISDNDDGTQSIKQGDEVIATFDKNSNTYYEAEYTYEKTEDEHVENGKSYYVKVGEAKYASTSAPLTLTIKNYVSANVSVKAEVGTATSTENNLIPLAAKEEDLTSATKATLLLTLNVGTVSGNITSDGKTVTKEVDAQMGNFKTVGTGTGFKLEEKTKEDNGGSDVEWTIVAITLSGKVNEKTVTSEDEAPSIQLTWTVKAKDEESDSTASADPAIAIVGDYSRASTSNKFTLSNIGDLTITKVTGYMDDGPKVRDLQSTEYSVNSAKTELTINGTNAPFGAGAVGKERGIGVTLSDGTELKVTFEVKA